MQYIPLEDGTLDAVVNVKFKVGDRAYQVDAEKAIQVVDVQGLRIHTYFTRAGQPDSLVVMYVIKQVGYHVNKVHEAHGSHLFGTVDEAVAFATGETITNATM